jgi:hypothetical protein
MMRATFIAVALGISLTACGSDDDASNNTSSGQHDSGVGELESGPGAFTKDYATSKDFLTHMDARVKGSSPHGSVQIWYSSNIESIIGSAGFEAPEGTTSIKEFDMDSDGTLDGFAVMVKKEAGYDADNGDWYYEMRDPSGSVMPDPAPGKIADCISCHVAAKKTDYLAGTALH